MASWDTMAIQAPVSSPSAPVAAAPAPLAPGDRIEARVVGPGADGLLRLATAAGLIDADLPADLPAGSRASFIVQSVGARLTLSLIAAAAPGSAVAAGSAADAPASLQDSARSAVLQAVRQAALAGQDSPAPLLALLARLTPSTALPAPLRDAAAALTAYGLSAEQVADPEALTSAVARSGLFGEARAAAGRPGVTDFKSVLATVLVAANAWKPAADGPANADSSLPTAAGPGVPTTAKAAGQGVLLEAAGDARLAVSASVKPADARPGQADETGGTVARPATVRGGTGAVLPQLASLPAIEVPKTAADGVNASPAARPAAQLTGTPTPSDTTAPQQAHETAATVLERTALPKTAFVDPASAGRAVDSPAPNQDPARPIQDGQASPKPPSDAPRPGAALALLAQLLGHDAADVPAPSATPNPQAAGRSPPPQADRAPAPSLPVPDRAADLPPEMPAGVLRATVIERTEAVLDRIVLSQLASLPAEATGQPTAASQPGAQNSSQNGPAQSWVMDLPLRLPGETAAAQLRVSRDGSRGAEGVDAPKGWTVEFAVDTTATGPVHARLRLGGPMLGVTLWAERPATLAALQDAAPDLRRALDEAAFSVETISVLAGAPRLPRPARPGSLVDARS